MSTDSPASSKPLAHVRGLVTATLLLASPAQAQNADSSISDNSLRLPIPTGIYAVGSRLMHLVDPNRPDTLSQDPGQYREIIAQIWYPIDVPAAAEVIAYLPQPLQPRLRQSKRRQPRSGDDALGRGAVQPHPTRRSAGRGVE